MANYERRSTGLGAGTMTIALIVVNILVFLFGFIDRQNRLIFLALTPAYVVQAGAWWQIVTYMFVHANWSHIFFNMLALFLFGTQLEHRMGSGEFLLFYFVCGIGAGLVTMLINNATGMGAVPVVGASGAIYGLLLAFAAFFPNDKIYIFGILPMRAPVAVLVFAGIEIVMQLTGLQSGVAHLAHLSGLLFAYFYMLFRYRINALSLFFRRR
jgi:membrane associated rhomboid family serine protease